MRSVSNNRWLLHWPKSISAAHCCGFVRKMSQCVSVVLSWADDSSWAEWSPGRAWRVRSVEQCGKMLPAPRFRYTDNSCVIFPVLSHWFSLPFILPFCLVSFSAARSERQRSAADLDSLKSSDVVPVTHLKLLLFAGGSFSQALCRACSLLSWSWMLQNGTQNTRNPNIKRHEIPKNLTSSWVGTDLEAWIQSLYSSYVISGSGSSRRYDFSAPEAEWTRRKCVNAHIHVSKILTQLAQMRSWLSLSRWSSTSHSMWEIPVYLCCHLLHVIQVTLSLYYSFSFVSLLWYLFYSL